MSYTTDRSENPVGPDNGPSPLLKIPLWQVLVALFVLAVLVTAWKFYEQHFIAPTRPIQWQPFSEDQFILARRRQRSVLVWVQPENTELHNALLQAAKTPVVQQRVYLARVQTFALAIDEALACDNQTLQSIAESMIDRHGRNSAGGLVYIDANARQPPRLLHANNVTSETWPRLLDADQTGDPIETWKPKR